MMSRPPDVTEGLPPAGLAALHMHATYALEQVQALCDEENIPILPVKGIVLARTLYGGPWERPLSDVDLRLRPRDLPRLRAVLRRKGLRVLMDSRVYGNVVFSCEGMTFDAECTVGPPGLCGLMVDDLLRRATWNRELFSFPFREVEGHDHALLLMVNVYKDHVVHASTRAIEDLLRVSQQKDFRPPVLASRCVAAGNGTLGFVLASYLGERFVSPPWQAVAQALAPGPRPLYARAMARLLESPRPLWQEDLLRYACRGASDHRAQQIRSLLVMALWALEQRLVQKRF